MKRLNKIDEQYVRYKKQYKQLEKEGILRRGTRMFTQKEFSETMKDFKGYGVKLTEGRKLIIEAQSKFGSISKSDIYDAYRYYRGGGYRTEGIKDETGTYFGQSYEDAKGGDDGLFLGKTYKEFKKNITAHQIIAMRIRLGDSREEVLEEYGY